MMRNLQGKVAWVTGAGTGIGEAGAIALSQAGMRVILSGRRREKIEQVAAQCPGETRIEPLNVSDKDAVNAVAGRIIEEFGRLDVMVASADRITRMPA